ncbi:hypothetical protein NIES39_A07440 [Arthrospira platensis NIES-39]|jgi:hypothetical protein|nr:hypothetical protein NIES39_A07440 [Arthrospira platensis NIES-39]
MLASYFAKPRNTAILRIVTFPAIVLISNSRGEIWVEIEEVAELAKMGVRS